MRRQYRGQFDAYLSDVAPVFGGYPRAVLTHELVGVPSKARRPDCSLPQSPNACRVGFDSHGNKLCRRAGGRLHDRKTRSLYRKVREVLGALHVSSGNDCFGYNTWTLLIVFVLQWQRQLLQKICLKKLISHVFDVFVPFP